MRRWLEPLVWADATSCAVAERAVSKALGGSCQVPLAAYAQISNGDMTVRALVAEPDGSVVMHAEASGPVTDAHRLGEQAAATLMDKGAREILSRLLAADNTL